MIAVPALTDAAVMTQREVRRGLRSIDGLITSMVLPVLILTMFVFVFGGAISTGGHYINYVVPGIIILCAGFGSASTAASVSLDMESGIIDRFKTMPIFGSSVLVGHVTASVIRNLVATTIVVGFALAYGFRPGGSLGGWLAAAGLLVLLIVALTWVACAIGLVVGPDAANAVTFVMLFLPYVSSGFVPTDSMPQVLHAFAEHQPITPIVESMRGWLMGTPVDGNGGLAVAWCVGVLAIGVVASAVLYRRRRAR
jgi:ABC-2 type transport system permease protein